jgi:DNA (cytosine-5)-methyltransferase 1
MTRVAHIFAGCGGSACGMELAGWHGAFAVEVDRDRCQTLRHNFSQMTLASWPQDIPVHFYTFPCTNYTHAANVHDHWRGDSLYLEALREAVLLWPEVIVIENVLGMRKFPRVMETWRNLPHYHATEFEVHGESFTLQKKARLFLILHRQRFDFKPLESYAPPQPRLRLHDYLDEQADVPVAPYILKRLAGAYRDVPIVYEPGQHTPVNLFTNYKRDRSNFLLRTASGVRPFSVREVARLHGFPESFHFAGSLNSQYAQIIDSVMVPVAQAVGLALNDYFAAIPGLAEQPKPHGHRVVVSPRPVPKFQQLLWEVPA